MKIYFVVSDIHSFYDELVYSLKKAGFRKTNQDHILVVLGDFFDRGPDAIKVFKFIRSIPKSRRVIVRGNHELLFLELLKKKNPQQHDFSNGTVDTFCQIASNADPYNYYDPDMFKEACYFSGDHGISFDDYLQNKWNYIKALVKNHPITKWIKSKEFKNYWEQDNFIGVHSFIPTKLKDAVVKEFGLLAYGFENPDCFEYNPNWRGASDALWEEATWGCPYSQYQHGLFFEEEQKGKQLIVGHWHTSDFFKKLKYIHLYNHKCAPIYYSKGLIGIDGGVTYDYYYEEWNHPQNVLVIKDGKCYAYSEELKQLELLVEPEAKYERTIETVSILPDGTKVSGSKDFIEDNEYHVLTDDLKDKVLLESKDRTKK